MWEKKGGIILSTTGTKKRGFSEEISNHFKEKNLQFMKYPSESIGVYSSIDKLYNFVKKEVDFWIEVTTEIPGNHNTQNAPIIQIKNHFNSILTQLSNLRSHSTLSRDSENKIDNIISLLSKEQFPAIFSISEEAKLLKDVNEKYSISTLNGCLKGLFNNPTSKSNYLDIQTSDLQDKRFLLGFNLAIKFRYPEIENDLFKIHKESTKEVLESAKETQADFTSLITEDQKNLLSEFGELKSALKEEKENYSEKHSQLIQEKQKKFELLEETYQEHLKLKEPAEYWKIAAQEYEDKGNIWRNWTFWFGGFYIAGLIFLLLFAQVENNFDLSSVKFTIVLTVIISIGFLVLNLFIKLSTSNFHLANDARERHHLTYVYLALLNETDISGEEKSIVLQSLFSRAESGLIRSDSGPQLPGNQAINALIKKEGHR